MSVDAVVLSDRTPSLLHLELLTLEGAPRADAEPDLALSDSLCYSVDYLEREPTAALDLAAVRVGTHVRGVLDELVDEVSVRAVDLDAVAAGAQNGVACGLRKGVDVFFYLCEGAD